MKVLSRPNEKGAGGRLFAAHGEAEEGPAVAGLRSAGSGARHRLHGRPGRRGRRAAGPPARGHGASGSRAGGCGGTRSARARERCAMLRPRWCRTSAAGVKRTRKPRRLDANAEVDVLFVEEEGLVEAADRLEMRAPREQAGARDPDGLVLGRVAPRGQGAGARVPGRDSADEPTLPPFREGSEVGPRRDLHGAVGADRAGPHDPHQGPRSQRLEQPLDRPRAHLGVAVEEEDEGRAWWLAIPGCWPAHSPRSPGSR